VGGKELFARKGATQFQGDDPAVFVTAGMIGSGDFSATPSNLFVSDAAWIPRPRRRGCPTKAAPVRVLRCRRWPLPTGPESRMKEPVGVRGSFWVDPQSLDLLRIEQHDVDLPSDLNIRDIATTIAYARTRIGSSNPLLPQVLGSDRRRFLRRPA